MTSSERGPRWDPDPRGIGVADARSFVPAIDALRGVAEETGWVAEEPEAHLLPHFRDAVAADGSPLAIDSATTAPDGTFVVETRWVGDPGAEAQALRVAAAALIAAVTESTTLVRERREADADVYDVVTGTLPGESRFATHGHTLRLRVVRTADSGR